MELFGISGWIDFELSFGLGKFSLSGSAKYLETKAHSLSEGISQQCALGGKRGLKLTISLCFSGREQPGSALLSVWLEQCSENQQT